MNNIYQVNKEFDFSQLSLANPNGLQGGAYFTKLKMNNGPLYVQLPRSFTKQGIVKTEKKIYTDLLFSYDDSDVVEWLLALEERVQEIIYEKRELWFQQDLELDDIQTAFNSGLRSYKGNKYLIRTNIVTPKHINYKPNIQIFDEDENPKTIEEITSSKPIISIIEVAGVKFTSRNFQLDVYLKQVMMLDNKPLFNTCLIKKNDNTEDDNEAIQSLEKNTKIPILKPDDSSNDIIDTDSDNNSDNNSDTSFTEKKIVNAGSETVTIETLNDETPQEAVETPQEAVEIPQEPVETPQEADETPQEAVETSEEILEAPQEVIETVQETSDEKENNLEKNADIHTNDSDKNEKNDLMEEINIGDYKDLGNNESISLKEPSDVYIEIYKEAKEKARKARIMAIKAYLEAKKVKKTYLLDNYIDSDSDSETLFGTMDEESLQNELNEETEQTMNL